MQAVLFVAVALLPLFGLRPGRAAGRWRCPCWCSGITAFLALGVVVGSFADTPEAVAAIANCLMVPMAFLSGSFFPLDAMPAWLQTVSRVLPLRYLNDGVVRRADRPRRRRRRRGRPAAALAGFAVVFGAVALRTFRWSDRS